MMMRDNRVDMASIAQIIARDGSVGADTSPHTERYVIGEPHGSYLGAFNWDFFNKWVETNG